MEDRYSTFADLVASEPEDAYRIFVCDRGSSVVIAAPHAGGIEPGTSEISLALAADSLSCYLFEGRKAKDNCYLHITSSSFDEPQCRKLLQSSDTVVTIHGERSNDDAVYLGGLDSIVLTSLRAALTEHGFSAKEHENPDLQGHSKHNICNIGRTGIGIQLEVSMGMRRTFFTALTQNGRQSPTSRLNDFCVAVRKGLHINRP
jgi:phage replication-related protein YjqB (UPF0714/DUF867 family)